MTSIGRRIATSAIWTAIETWGQQAVLFVIFLVLARLLGPDAIGYAVLAMVAPVILSVPVTKGIPEAIVQRAEIEPAHLDSAFWLLVAGGVCLTGLVWILAGAFAAFLREPLLKDLIGWTCVIVTIQALAAVPIAILKRELNFRLLAFRTLIGTAAGGSLGLALAAAGFGVWSLVWMQIAKAAVETTVLLAGSTWRPRLRYSHAHCMDLMGFAGPIVGSSVWNFVNDELPKTALGAFLGPGAVGVYALARRPLDFLTGVLVNPLASIAMPAVSRLQGDRTNIDRFFNMTVRMAGLIGFPAFMGLAAIAPDAVPLLLGERWATGVPAIQVLMLLGLVRTIDSLCAGTVLALGYSGLILKLNVAYTALAAIFLVIAAQINLETTMAAIVACNLILVPVFLYYTQRLARIDVMKPLSMLPRLSLATALMFSAVTVWRHVAPEHASRTTIVVWAIAIGALVYGASAMILLRPELLTARELLRKVRG
jgi:O-antigen/teichoic acid export membrane protein